jgi:hypothetical protein
MFDLPEAAILFADSSRGVYIPQFFADSIRRECVTGVDSGDWAILETGPDHELYWDAWHDVESNAIVTDSNGQEFRLYQDGDLWLVPIEWNPED